MYVNPAMRVAMLKEDLSYQNTIKKDFEDKLNKIRGGIKMTQKTLKQESQEFTPKVTLNITDLDRVDLSWPVEDRTGKDAKGEEFSYKVMVVNNQEFRVPGVVLGEIKKMLKLKPDMDYVKVTKKGSGKSTRYTVELAE